MTSIEPTPEEPAAPPPLTAGERRLAIHQARQDFIDQAARRIVADYENDPGSYFPDDLPAVEAARLLVELLKTEPT